jgi:hypothetical protein
MRKKGQGNWPLKKPLVLHYVEKVRRPKKGAAREKAMQRITGGRAKQKRRNKLQNVVLRKVREGAGWIIRRHPIGLYLVVKQDKTVYNGWKGRGKGGEGPGSNGRVIPVVENKCNGRQHPDLPTTGVKPREYIPVSKYL